MRLTLYDYNNLYYSSFYITGFTKVAKEMGCKFRISHSIPDLLHEAEVQEEKEVLFAILLFKLETQSGGFYFVIYTRDGNKRGSYHQAILKRCKYYFKVNYKRFTSSEYSLEEGQTESNNWSEKIIPINPFFPIRPKKSSNLLPRVIPSSVVNWGFVDILKRFKAIGNILPLDRIHNLRKLPKTSDVFFIMTYYGKDRHSADVELRYQIMRGLQKHKELKVKVGFITKDKLPEHMADLQLSTLPFEEYVSNLAQSKVAIYVRGLHECHSFKMTEQLVLGLPVVGQTIINNADELLKMPFFAEQYSYETADEIVGNVVSLLQDELRMKKLSESNRNTFDKYLTPNAVCSSILSKMIHEP